MLTPKDIDEMEFPKAVFGGYDMTSVDDFLEDVTKSYTALYKENSSLKAKLKVLVEKVEEYRSTEDAMRMALLTAQKMSDTMTDSTKTKCDDMIADASRAADELRENAQKELTDEYTRLEAAKAKTAEFVTASRKIIEQYSLFLDKLGGVTVDVIDPPVAHREPVTGPARSPEPEPAASVIDDIPDTRIELPDEVLQGGSAEPEREPYGETEIPDKNDAPAQPRKASDMETRILYEKPEEGETISLFNDNTPSETPPQTDLSAETRRFDIDAIRRAQQAAALASGTATVGDPEAPSRPKFDFTDLQFGVNYQEQNNKSNKRKSRSQDNA